MSTTDRATGDDARAVDPPPADVSGAPSGHLDDRTAAQRRERNRLLIEEFRTHGGAVDEDKFKGATLLVLTTVGRRSGRPCETPMRYLLDGDRYVVFASHQGSPVDPDWCKNLLAAGRAAVEVGDEQFEVEAEVLVGTERDDLYRRQVERCPDFGDYERRTTRSIPVIALRRAVPS